MFTANVLIIHHLMRLSIGRRILNGELFFLLTSFSIFGKGAALIIQSSSRFLHGYFPLYNGYYFCNVPHFMTFLYKVISKFEFCIVYMKSLLFFLNLVLKFKVRNIEKNTDHCTHTEDKHPKINTLKSTLQTLNDE